jgi:hypothetical protein
MTLPFLKVLRAGPPPPKVVLLPDGIFFTRSIAIASGSSMADVNGQVDLALETLSPFPAAQLYHGFFWPPGADRALVYAAYRRRFTAEQMAGWDGAEVVLPTFATVLGAGVGPNTTMIIPSVEGMTALYWDASSVPERIIFRQVAADATDSDLAHVRDQLLAVAPKNRSVVLHAPPTPATANSETGYVFNSGTVTSVIPVAQVGALDVRDKAELLALRRSRARDLALWRGFLSIVGLLFLLALAELALIGQGMWQKTRLVQINAQRPVVEKVIMAQNVTTRINELSTKRLLPFEMIELVSGEPRPGTVQFMRASTVGLYGLNVEAQSTSPEAPSAYQSAVAALPAVEKVEIRDQRARDNLMTFTLAVTFRPENIKPGVRTP